LKRIDGAKLEVAVSMANQTMTLVRAWLWPDVSTRRHALDAIKEAFWVSLVFSGLALLFVLIQFSRRSGEPFDFSLFMSPLFLALAAFGIRAKSRFAALSAFTVFVVSRLYFLIEGGPTSPILASLIALALWHGVRGTFAYHKLPSIPAGTPSIEESFQAMRRDPKTAEPRSTPD
jgi:hypothetical protein